ncbi:hypothetical protein LB553_01015 [Mesorhizobium sp. CA8]|uniref:hypothetical protein n=1 Tax=Mesorhizobium sp. CA8 TaxID=2876637 RepID=UPI001CCECD50|nr:hypothetical protein [Mesorhizobium sp. CA8]MBZ9759468.1 hypothetical protein [Mesorhizobium sp. CA8]
MKEPVNWWKAEEDEVIVRMIGEGRSGSEIGKILGRSRMAVISRNLRLKERQERQKQNRKPYAKVRFTAEEDAKIAEMSDDCRSGREIGLALKRSAASIIKRARTIGKPLHARSGAKKQERPEGTVIPFPVKQRRPQHKPAERPKLMVVSNNIPLMVEDWLARHGGPRRFTANDTTDPIYVADYLREHGVIAKRLRGDWNSPTGKWSVSRGTGRPKAATWSDVLRIADGFRASEGLQPFLAPQQQPEQQLRRAR